MNNFIRLLALSAVVACVTTARAAIITVNTEDNADFSAGKTNLVTAINSLQDGDTIAFNISGAGPHFLITPPMVTGPGGGGGYPEITKNNVTIDGYTQPGASPNTNPILATNNAQLKIVLDSRGGGAHVWDISGYGTSESGILVVSGNNAIIKGLCFLGVYGDDSDTSPKRYGVALGNRGGNDAHINGCWFGVAPDRTTIAGLADGITGFRHRDPTDVLVNGVVVGVKPSSANPRAEFNVMVDMMISIIVEGAETRISGNFIGVLPDGLTRVPNPKALNPDQTENFGWEGHIELARAPYNIVIGTDGDGVNDADERNLLSGGVHDSFASYTTESTYNHIIEFYSGGTRTNNIIAGNYIGVGIDGKTYFTNATRLKNNWSNGAETRIGSDFDGVSDDIEANVIANNHPFNVFYPDLPTPILPPDFAGLDAGERVSVRGNVLLNNNLAPYSYADGSSFRLTSFMNYSAPYMSTSGDIIPVLSTNSSSTRLIGTYAVGVDPYTNIIIDVYQLDPEGWENGKLFNFQELLAPDFQSYYGFPQGGKYLGSLVDNGAQDSDPAVGSFNLDISALQAGSGSLTVTANYSADPPGTHNGRTHTSNFSNPLVTISTIAADGRAVSLGRGGGIGTYLLQKKFSLTDPTWQNVLTSQRENEAVALQGSAAFFRLIDNVTNTVTPFTAFLSGDGERPQVTTSATGLGSFALEENTLTYYITFAGLSAPATAAHIHGPTNTTGSIGVIIPFSNVPSATSGTISGSVIVSDQNKSNLLSGLTYANIHNTNNAGGEIRGQIGPTQLKATLNGDNERPTPVVTAGRGAATLTRIGNQLFFNITYTGLSSPATAAHIHGRADTSGSAGVLMALPTPSGTSGTISGSLTLDNATLSAIVDGLSYVNIHTEINTDGEIRGQITP